MIKVTLERWGRNALAQRIGRAFPLAKTSAGVVRDQWVQGKIEKILLLRPHQGLGDLLLATPMLSALKRSRPDVQIHLLADRYNAGAVVGNTRIDKLWTWDKKKARNPGYLFSFIRGLRAERYDAAIIISSHTPSFTSFLLARVSGAKVVWAFTTEVHYDGATWSRWLANVSVDNPPPDDLECAKFMALLKPLGVSGPYEPEFHLTPEMQEWGRQRWQKYNFPPGRPVIALFLGGNPARPERLWPAASWAQLARTLIDKEQAIVLAILPPKKLVSGSGKPEPGIYDEFSRLLGQDVAVFDEPGLKQAAALLSHASLFVCPDGGLMHVAVASRVPTVGLFFGTDPSRWVPPVAWAIGLRSPNAQPAGLTPDLVYSTVAQRLRAPLEPSIR